MKKKPKLKGNSKLRDNLRRLKIKSSNFWKNYNQRPERKYHVYITNAKKRNLNFNITFTQFLSLTYLPCYYCHESLLPRGLDRVDSKRGYDQDNVVSCCEICNRMKNDYSAKDFINKIKDIYKHQTTFLGRIKDLVR